MRWRDSAGQAAAEAAVMIPLVLLLLMVVLAVGYGVVAQLMVVHSAGQGARLGAALCADGQPPAAVAAAARREALRVMDPLAGPKQAEVRYEDPDLVVRSTFNYLPPVPGARAVLGRSVVLRATVRYRCW